MPCRSKAAVYRAMSRPWPTLAAACWVARSLGRRVSPSGTRPEAIAPEETRTSWVFWVRRAARAAASAQIRSSAISPSGVVSEEEPTLTTTRAAVAMSGRWEPGVGAARAQVLPGVVPAGGAGSAGHRRGRVPVEHHRVVRFTDQDLGARF